MQDVHFKMFFNNKPATEDQLERVREITVEQEIDMAWEAQIVIPIFSDDKGKWTGEEEDFMIPYSQVRIEIKIGTNQFVPLIDGPIVGHHNKMSSEPGQSSTTLIVQDDSARLNRFETNLNFEKNTCENIATQIFKKSDHIKSTDISKDPSSPKLPVVIQHGTDMQILRSLARQNGIHAYVLPGENPGQSIGCFKPFPIHPDIGLPPFILTGEDRNISEFNVGNESNRPSIFKASYLNAFDKSTQTAVSSFEDMELLGSEPVLAGKPSDTVQNMHLDGIFPENLDKVVRSRALDSSYSFEATGKVDICYPGVLQPYKVVTVLGINGRLSGDYLISKVTHKITLSTYLQSFSVRRNSRSSGYIGGGSNSSSNACGSSGGSGISGGFSGSASANISLDVGIF